MKFKDRLKELRIENNCTAAKLASYLNYGGTAISNYESGRNEPSIDILIKIAEYFDVSVDYLVGKTNNKKYELNIDNEFNKIFSELNTKDKYMIIDIIKFMKYKKYL